MPDIKKAVALSYKSSSQKVPKLIAKGQGAIAKEIIAKAEAFDISIFSNKALLDSLIKLELDEEIPVALYQSVAELFAWLHTIKTLA